MRLLPTTMILLAACGPITVPHAVPLDIPIGSFQEVHPKDGVQTVSLRGPSQLLAIQNHRQLFVRQALPDSTFPLKIEIPVPTLDDHSGLPIYLVVLTLGNEDGPHDGTCPEGVASSACVGVCMHCMPCCVPPGH